MGRLDRQEWQIKLLRWSAWAPGLEARQAWCDWLSGGSSQPKNGPNKGPDAENVPSRLRRRCSTVGRMALETSLRICKEAGIEGSDVHLVYCSRNGELITLKLLFDSLFEKEPLSPTRFSNSVHHTPTGYFSLITKNRRISRTISGGDSSFACGILEALSLLHKYPGRPVLLVYSDEYLPEPFDQLLDKPEFPFAVAMLLANSGEGEAFRIHFDRETDGLMEEGTGEDAVFPFLGWLVRDLPSHRLKASFGGMTWTR